MLQDTLAAIREDLIAALAKGEKGDPVICVRLALEAADRFIARLRAVEGK